MFHAVGITSGTVGGLTALESKQEVGVSPLIATQATFFAARQHEAVCEGGSYGSPITGKVSSANTDHVATQIVWIIPPSPSPSEAPVPAQT
jgi:hypothetical protein